MWNHDDSEEEFKEPFVPHPSGPLSPRSGLSNLGNTCFMNSLLQCLASLPELDPNYLRHYTFNPYIYNPQDAESFLESLESGKTFGYPKHRPVLAISKDPLSSAFYSLAARMRGHGRQGAVNPSEFHRAVGQAFPALGHYSQEDSHELYMLMCDYLGSQERWTGPWAAFRGRERISYSCDVCSNTTHTMQHFTDASLTTDVNCEDVQELLRTQFTAAGAVECERRCTACALAASKTQKGRCEEILGKIKFDEPLTPDEHAFAVSVSQQAGAAAVRTGKTVTAPLLEFAPDILTIHIKRYNQSFYRVKKATKSLVVPEDLVLDCAENLYSDEKVPVDYELYGAVFHSGTLCFGHYMAITRNSEGWAFISDSCVTPITKRDALARAGQAALLFYRRKTTRECADHFKHYMDCSPLARARYDLHCQAEWQEQEQDTEPEPEQETEVKAEPKVEVVVTPEVNVELTVPQPAAEVQPVLEAEAEAEAAAEAEVAVVQVADALDEVKTTVEHAAEANDAAQAPAPTTPAPKTTPKSKGKGKNRR